MTQDEFIQDLLRQLDKAQSNLTTVLKSQHRAQDKIDRLEAELAELKDAIADRAVSKIEDMISRVDNPFEAPPLQDTPKLLETLPDPVRHASSRIPDRLLKRAQEARERAAATLG